MTKEKDFYMMKFRNIHHVENDIEDRMDLEENVMKFFFFENNFHRDLQ